MTCPPLRASVLSSARSDNAYPIGMRLMGGDVSETPLPPRARNTAGAPQMLLYFRLPTRSLGAPVGSDSHPGKPRDGFSRTRYEHWSLMSIRHLCHRHLCFSPRLRKASSFYHGDRDNLDKAVLILSGPVRASVVISEPCFWVQEGHLWTCQSFELP